MPDIRPYPLIPIPCPLKPSPASEELKTILDAIRTPERLNDHPWATSLVVAQALQQDPTLGQQAPGYRLISVVSSLFHQMLPSTPPRRGKRLDTRWCQFGMLAAEYFGPFLYRTPYCTSLRDAWGRIDFLQNNVGIGSENQSPNLLSSAYLPGGSALDLNWRC